MDKLDISSSKPDLAISPETSKDVQAVATKIQFLMAEHSRPIIIALDGRSGTDKLTLAKKIAASVAGIYIETDDFWAGGPNEEWDARNPIERSELAIDWRRLRSEVLEPLLSGQAASWHPFDFKNGHGLAEQVITKGPIRAIILDCAYSSRPELEDILDLKVLVEVPNDDNRRSRLVGREGETYTTDWHKRWDPAEEYYFTNVRNKSSFDMFIVNN